MLLCFYGLHSLAVLPIKTLYYCFRENQTVFEENNKRLRPLAAHFSICVHKKVSLGDILAVGGPLEYFVSSH